MIGETSETGGSKEAVVEKWMSGNGKKKTAFYERLKELPEEWSRRYQALPDKRSDSSVVDSYFEGDIDTLGGLIQECEAGKVKSKVDLVNEWTRF